MQFDEELPILLHGGQIVNRQAQLLSRGANSFKEVLTLRRARLGVNHHIGRNDFADALLNGVAQGMHLLEARGARHAHSGIDKVTIAGATHAYAVDIQHAIHARDGLGYFLLQALGRRV